MQGFQAKKDCFLHFFPAPTYCVYAPVCASLFRGLAMTRWAFRSFVVSLCVVLYLHATVYIPNVDFFFACTGTWINWHWLTDRLPYILPFHAFVTQARIEPGCDGWKANVLTTRLRRSQQCCSKMSYLTKVESSRTSLASRTSSKTHFEVLGLEASSPRKLACLRLEDSSIFWIVKILWSGWKIFWKTFFCGDRLKNFCEDLFFYWRALALVSLVLGLEHSCLCPRECLSSE